jgi:hypothetical protein
MLDWRKLGTRTDMFIAWAAGRVYGPQGYGRLLAQMLAQTKNDQPLPEACADAMAVPQAAEASMCPALRGEFEMISNSIALVN